MQHTLVPGISLQNVPQEEELRQPQTPTRVTPTWDTPLGGAHRTLKGEPNTG